MSLEELAQEAAQRLIVWRDAIWETITSGPSPLNSRGAAPSCGRGAT